MGPTLIFDKSALQGLSVDESMWLENFFITNITPLFFVETLADLEKEVRAGRTPEDIVGNIALKTPDMGGVRKCLAKGSYVNQQFLIHKVHERSEIARISA